MYHSFSSQSFLKPSSMAKSPHFQSHCPNDITVPKDYFHQHNQYDNNSNQSPNKSNLSTHSISKFKKKIKQIKCALKIAQQHNQELHQKLNQQKKYFIDQRKFLQTQISKYKSLYEMLIQNYELRSLQLKDAKKRIKKFEKNQSKNTSEINCSNCQVKSHLSPKKLQNANEQNLSNAKQLITQHEVSLQHLKHENKLLREQIVLKNKKLSQYQILLQTYQSQQRINRISPKHNKQLIQMRSKLQYFEQQNNKFKKDKQITQTKIKRLQIQLQSNKNHKDSIQKEHIKLKKQNQQLKIQTLMKNKIIDQIQTSKNQIKFKTLFQELTLKYNQILRFSYQIQKDFERQLHTMAKQLTRRQIVKKN